MFRQGAEQTRSHVRVTSIQLEIAGQPKEQALDNVMVKLDQAPQSDLLLLPEVWPSAYFSVDRYQADGEPLDGPNVSPPTLRLPKI